MKKRAPVRAVTFDLDDTLFDRRAALLRLLDRWLGEEEAGRVAEEVIAADGHGHAPRADFFRWFAGHCFSSGHDGESLAKRFRRDLPVCIAPDQGTLRMLEHLKAAGTPLMLLSNGSAAFQTAKLKACGAIPFFQKRHRLFSSTLGFSKPDPRAFEAVIDLLALDAREILFVGDDPERDIEGARAAGMQTCRVLRADRRVSGIDADMRIDSPGDLTSILMPA